VHLTWREVLRPFGDSLFSNSFLACWGDALWQPTEDDRTASGKLHIQFVSRIATQRLSYLEGEEKTALKSMYALFDKTRDIAEAHPKCRHFDALTWAVLNMHVRPFTAKWHRQSERSALDALDATDDFREELNALQRILQDFERVLLFLRDGAIPPPHVPLESDKENAIADEMRKAVAWGIQPVFGAIRDCSQVLKINFAEKRAILRRRRHYKLNERCHAAGLAISGGGIRSATFSLGVLVALAQRGLLREFDYLSTVSGGGYLGSFLSVFLKSAGTDVGLQRDELPFKREQGEAAALRHIRHHSKYFAVGSLWERLSMFSAQLLGMALNGLAVVWVLCLAVAAEWGMRSLFAATDLLPTTEVLRLLIWILLTAAVLYLVVLRTPRSVANRIARRAPQWLAGQAEAVIAVPLALVAGVLGWWALDVLHDWYGRPVVIRWITIDKTTWVAIAGTVPFVAPAFGTLFPRTLKRFGIALAVLTVIAAPLSLLGVYLFLYDQRFWFAGDFLGYGLPRGIVIAAVGLLVYGLVFDINATSPHRHYRRKLGQAYLIQPRELPDDGFDEDVSVNLSALGEHSPRAPYHLINCALNVPASGNIGMQGRLTDLFLFSPAYSGSPLIGYRATTEWEAVNRRLDVGTAMAISGGAAAPQMGFGTIKRFSFWLALLNVRLGYWVRRPGVWGFPTGAPGILYLLKEMIGSMDETGPWVNVSDGGHIENLGVYELLRRRCKYIVAIDGEQDAAMTFAGLTTLQRLAGIDLGVRIEINLDDLRLTNQGLSRSHFRFCRIRYPKAGRSSEDDFGYLLYVKLSLTGNEGEFIRRYRLDEPPFPHHSTADQFFSEAQFEAYRNLGEHVGDKLFLRAILGDLASKESLELEEWFQALGMHLLEPTTSERRP